MAWFPDDPLGLLKDKPVGEEKSEMSRGAQTAWIVGVLILMGLVALYFATRVDETSPYAECQRIIGWDEDCRLKIALRSLRGY